MQRIRYHGYGLCRYNVGRLRGYLQREQDASAGVTFPSSQTWRSYPSEHEHDHDVERRVSDSQHPFVPC